MELVKKTSAEALAKAKTSKSLVKRIRIYLLPIHKHELKKFIPTCLIFFFLAYIYDMLRILKSSLVVAQSDVGAEIIPFLKVWALIPGAFILTGLAIKLSHRFDREKIFYLMIMFFISFYILFMSFIYPNREALELTAFASYLVEVLPSGAKGFASMVQNWHLSTFYVVTELWGSILLSMLFWGFANEITNIEQATRFYPLFLLAANSAAIFAGLTSGIYAEHTFDPSLPFGSTAWEQSLDMYLLTAIMGGIIVMGLFAFMHRFNDGSCLSPARPRKTKEKVKLSMRECFAYLGRSKHLFYIALLVLSYNLVFNLTDVLWEDQLKTLYGDDAGGMAGYKSYITTMTGILAVLISIFVSGNLLRNFGWKYAAICTPVTVGLTGIVFFSILIWGEQSWLKSIILSLGSDPVHLSLIFGSIQVCFSRGCKYTLFDTAKEIAYIPLSTQEKRHGKAAIEGVGSRIGKSAGSILVQGLLLTLSSISAATPFMAVTIIFMLGLWCYGVLGLSRKLG